MPFILEQIRSEIYASAGGLAVVGPIINRHSGLKKRLKSVPLRHGIAHIDLVRTYLGLLCQGKNDLEAVEGIRDDRFYLARVLQLKKMDRCIMAQPRIRLRWLNFLDPRSIQISAVDESVFP